MARLGARRSDEVEQRASLRQVGVSQHKWTLRLLSILILWEWCQPQAVGYSKE
jgi:hypothetical protein